MADLFLKKTGFDEITPAFESTAQAAGAFDKMPPKAAVLEREREREKEKTLSKPMKITFRPLFALEQNGAQCFLEHKTIVEPQSGPNT